MAFNFRRAVAFVMVVIAWILLTFFFIGCANVDKVQEKEGWFPVGMDEDAQDRHNNYKYNMLDNGYDDPNMNIKVFNTKY
jgi:hypothetical protein